MEAGWRDYGVVIKALGRHFTLDVTRMEVLRREMAARASKAAADKEIRNFVVPLDLVQLPLVCSSESYYNFYLSSVFRLQVPLSMRQ